MNDIYLLYQTYSESVPSDLNFTCAQTDAQIINRMLNNVLRQPVEVDHSCFLFLSLILWNHPSFVIQKARSCLASKSLYTTLFCANLKNTRQHSFFKCAGIKTKALLNYFVWNIVCISVFY
jgi:hypothetical protein